MRNSIYLNAKSLLKSQAVELKRTSDDKGYINYEINNNLDSACRQFSFYAMKETISEKQAKLYSNWLANYACTLQAN